MVTGLPKSDKTLFSHLLMKGCQKHGSDAQNHTVFIKKACTITGKVTDWEFTTPNNLIDKINIMKKIDTNVKEIWSVLILLEVSIMPCTAYCPYLFPRASLTFVVGKLVDLHASFEDYNQCNNEFSLPKHDILHVFKNIVSANCIKLKRICEENVLFQELITKKSSHIYTAFIGTHRGEVPVDSVINVGLRSMMNDINLPNKLEALSVLHAGSKLIHTVNVTENSDENAKKLYDEMDNLLRSIYKIPIHWLLLIMELQQLCIEKDLKFIRFNDVFETLWKVKLNNHNKSELKIALNFFSSLGYIWYFEESSFSYVFSSLKWLLQTIESFMKMSIPDHGTTYISYKRFTYDGILTEKVISTLSKSLKVETNLMIRLLIHLKLAIPLNSCESIIAKEESEYFIPHRLPAVKNDEILSRYGNLQLEPLMLTYSSGTVHPSLFCMFAGYLLQNYETLSDDCNWSQPQESDDDEQFTFSNLITFPIDNDYSVTLYDKIFCLEIQIRKKVGEAIKHNDINCPTLRSITKVLRDVHHHFKKRESDLACGFHCTICKHFVQSHMMIVKPHKRNTWRAICCKDGRKDILTTDCYTVWFKQVGSRVSDLICKNFLEIYVKLGHSCVSCS